MINDELNYYWFKNEITNQLFNYKSYMYIYWNVCKWLMLNCYYKMPSRNLQTIVLISLNCIHFKIAPLLNSCSIIKSVGPVGWGYKIHQLYLYREVRPTHNECPRYDAKQSDGETPVMLELWGMQSTSSLPSLIGSLWPGVVAPDRILSMG